MRILILVASYDEISKYQSDFEQCTYISSLQILMTIPKIDF